MKPFIYLSALLITAGSAFGIVDYFKEKNKGTFATLYKEEEETPETPIFEKEKMTPLNAGNITEIAASKTTTEGAIAAKTTEAKKLKKKAPRKKVSLKMFTRGDEIERFTPPVVIEEPVMEKPVPAEPVKQPEVINVQPVSNVIIEKEEKRPSLRKMFSRASPRKIKKVEIKPAE